MLGLLTNCIPELLTSITSKTAMQVRYKWPNHRMIRDYKRRILQTEHAPVRLRINSLRKNDIMPVELQQVAHKELLELPVDSIPLRAVNRCIITSRPRGVVHKWRLSRFVFRDLSDHNKLSGVQRAMW